MGKLNDLRKRGISLVTAAFTVVSLSGCGVSNEVELEASPVATAVVMTDENALLLDVSSYQYFDGYSKIYDMYGNMMRIGNDNVTIIEGEDSQQKAKLVAENLVGENGHVSILSGYANNVEPQNDSIATAIVMTDENALILDVSSYQYFEEYSKIYDMYGNMMRIGNDNNIVIEGEHSQQMAKLVAEGLLSENAQISFYDDLYFNGKSR